jgi:hypothetical protein
MGRISIENVADAVRKISAMSTSQQLSVFDEIAKTQPNLLASCLVQNNLGVGNGGLEHTINMLLVCYQSMMESGFSWPVISEDEQERHLLRMTEPLIFRKACPLGRCQTRQPSSSWMLIPSSRFWPTSLPSPLPGCSKSRSTGRKQSPTNTR